MYCPACRSNRLQKTSDNTKTVDFSCPACQADIQLKSKAGRLGKKVRDAAYHPMIQRIEKNSSPHFAFLEYDKDLWKVKNLLFIPGFFITANTIERCRPLSGTARRAGWVGCNILFSRLPEDAKIFVVQNQKPISAAFVREKWARFAWLEPQKSEARGWATDVLRCVRSLGKQRFFLAEMYSFQQELQNLYPSNKFVKAKIRQQLQVLRDKGLLRFIGKGVYEAI
jgi:type II restriction enzyme